MALKKETKAKVTAKATTKAVKAVKKPASKSKTSEVEFKVFAPASDSVAVAGDFNSWKPIALKRDRSGVWSGKVKLSGGTYQYKLVFNGQYWETDNSNPERVSDGHGGENSVKRV